ncbi:DUF4259 domain-containing protein [Pseudarthrobacter sp. NamE2]|uniref:DUF4259 domain-containing protein n=1 Tax=Pseudarthrobacter sp. NamE2 TaxID=2576838 RepID=UPI00148555C7|nr:DUF4259 domain-containing protein [Pseudarthrobacter sp. NamE2]
MGLPAVENDDALDWLDGAQRRRADVVCGTLEKARNGYVEAPQGSVAIAAVYITAVVTATRPGSYLRMSPTG